MWLTGRCISYGQAIAYVPVVDVVKDACGIEEADGEDVIGPSSRRASPRSAGTRPICRTSACCCRSIRPSPP